MNKMNQEMNIKDLNDDRIAFNWKLFPFEISHDFPHASCHLFPFNYDQQIYLAVFRFRVENFFLQWQKISQGFDLDLENQNREKAFCEFITRPTATT